MQTFCPPLHSLPIQQTRHQTHTPPISHARRSSKRSRSSRSSRPPPPPSPPPQQSETNPALKTPDKFGITLETRLREELEHPLRSPRQTLFTALSLSATIGLLSAISRFASHSDSLTKSLQNISIDVTAALVFAALAFREYQFGQTSLRKMSGQPFARDLSILRADTSQKAALETLLKKQDVIVIAGDRRAVTNYLEDGDDGLCLVSFFVNGEGGGQGILAEGAEWVDWIGAAVPPRGNVALFRIPELEGWGFWRKGGAGEAKEYIVAVGKPDEVPRPSDARPLLDTTSGL